MEKVDMTRDSGVIDSGHYNSPPLEFKLVLELAKWLLWIYLRIFSKNFPPFLRNLNHWRIFWFVNSDGWHDILHGYSGVSLNPTLTIGFINLANAPPTSWTVRYHRAIYRPTASGHVLLFSPPTGPRCTCAHTTTHSVTPAFGCFSPNLVIMSPPTCFFKMWGVD